MTELEMTEVDLRAENGELKERVRRLNDELASLRSIEKELLQAINKLN